jgi:drug/metabolite transporter (DMT)-like permease
VQTRATPLTHATARALPLGLLAALFFSVTFLLNRSMGLAGGDWGWMASLRFLIMAVLLALPVAARREWRPLRRELLAHWPAWLLWSTIGFGVFYAPLTYASSITPAWLLGGTWQITILMGLLISPLLYRDHRRRVPLAALSTSAVIVAGVLLMQFGGAGQTGGPHRLWLSLLLTLIGATAYPLGNRAIMLHLERSHVTLSVYQRVFGMTLSSLPFWLLLAVTSYARVGMPSGGEILQSGLIALCSGVIATLLFFRATDMVRSHPTSLAAVEATQAAEVLFVLLGDVWLLGTPWPGRQATVGIALVLLGIAAYSVRVQPPAEQQSAV